MSTIHVVTMSSDHLVENKTETSPKVDVPYTLSEVVVAVIAVIGNALVILVFWYHKKLRGRTKYHIISLAVADLLVGLVGIPVAIFTSIGLTTNVNFCLFMLSFFISLCTISIFCLVAVSIDRYWAVLHPLSYLINMSYSTTRISIIVCWVGGTCVGFLPMMGWRIEEWGSPENNKCLFSEIIASSYLVFFHFAIVIIPALILAVLYTHIYTVILRQMSDIVLFSPREHGSVRSSDIMLRQLHADRKKEMKATHNLSIIVLFFIICWFPIFTINTIEAFWSGYRVPGYLTKCCIILSHANSSLNPLLYAYHLKDFQKVLKNLILCSEKGEPQATKQITLKSNGVADRLNTGMALII